MEVRHSALAFCLAFWVQPLVAQTVEDRLTLLERQVQELRRLHDLPSQPSTNLPVELIGNEHTQWGYPGGSCTFLIKEHFVTCHHGTRRVSEWVTYHLTKMATILMTVLWISGSGRLRSSFNSEVLGDMDTCRRSSSPVTSPPVHVRWGSGPPMRVRSSRPFHQTNESSVGRARSPGETD